ncbi:hypothetical protein P7C70_g6571, partial [Phenoliferia sp. Uapishka_3]
MESTILINNIHCPSCVAAITSLWTSPPLSQPPSSLSVSLLTGLVTTISTPTLHSIFLRVLADAGFEVIDPTTTESASHTPTSSPASASPKWFESKKGLARREEKERKVQREREEAHKASCRACRVDEKGKAKECLVPISFDELSGGMKVTTILVGGMTCSSCIGSVSRILSKETDERIREVVVTLIPGRAVVTHVGMEEKELLEMLEDGGYDATVVETVILREGKGVEEGWMESTFVIEGMTCASCVGSLSSTLKPENLAGVRSSSVTLLPPRAVIIHDPNITTTAQLIESIEDGGYGAEFVSTSPIEADKKDGVREVKLRVDGMFCDTCSKSINSHLSSLIASKDLISATPLSHSSPYTTISYIPHPPHGFTLRTLQSQIASLGPFSLHPIRTSDLLTSLAKASQHRESQSLLLRLCIAFLFAIPTFIIAIVAMSLLPKTNNVAIFFQTPIWGNASRGTIALFILATPVQFGVGSLFYSRAWKGLRGVWKRGSWKDKLLRWGTMDSLVALGTTAGWSASVAFMVIDVQDKGEGMKRGGEMGYFDSSVFLVLFILAGRWLEGVSRRRTGDAVEELGSMKAAEGILYNGFDEQDEGDMDKKDKSEDDDGSDIVTLADAQPTTSSSPSDSNKATPVDFLEVGDTLIIPSGSSVPLDSILLPNSPSSTFDESSLTGESAPILKSPTDSVYSGSTNLGPSAVLVRVTSHAGETMLDTIVRAVGDAMAKKAGIERLADVLTGFFVPIIVGIAGITFGVWILRGYMGGLEESWKDGGSWALFAVQFTVAVLVVACPCGIGLAAPTAQMVGLGLAARHGIVPYGGGEAFQNATRIDAVCFDKTGSLTAAAFRVADHHLFFSPFSTATLYKIISVVEEASSHPISLGIKTFCRAQQAAIETITLIHSEEVPGRGLSATVQVGSSQYEVLIGNQLLLEESETTFELDSREVSATLVDRWANEGSSIVFVAIRSLSSNPPPPFAISGIFAAHDPPRAEASLVIAELERQGIAVFMCTGDNAVTALAVAKTVGIAPERVFSGVLPVGKRDCIEQLQTGGAADAIAAFHKRAPWWKRIRKAKTTRAKVLFVGDGINDLVALAQADVGVSMGTGAAVTQTNSDFCLLSSNLLGLLTLLALARATYNKILTNFAWAILFNACLVPVAAGAFYDLGQTRLPPVWASLAMALSSVSVVSSSLLLRYTFRVPEAVRRGAV